MSTAKTQIGTTLEALATRLGKLERQRAAEREALEQRLAAQEAEVARLRAERAPADAGPALILPPRLRRGRAAGGGDTGDETQGRRTSRRRLLRLGGAAAAAGVAAGALGLANGGRAQARGLRPESGVAWQTGNVFADTQTVVWPFGDYDPTANDVLQVRWGIDLLTLDGLSGGSSNPSAAITAYDTTGSTANSGVYATSTGGGGVVGIGGSTGVYGRGYNGVYGDANGKDNNSFAVFGDAKTNSTTAIGVGGSSNYVGVKGVGNGTGGVGGWFLGGRAPLSLGQGAAPGAPAANAHFKGDVYLDSNATVWVCTADGTPGTWRQVAAAAAGYAGGALNLLPVPIRLLDTRAGATLGNLRPNAPVAYHGTLTVPAAGVTYSGQTIPSGATAVFGLLTAALAAGVNCGDGSSAIAYATGATRPGAVSVIFNPQDLHGAYTANFAVVQTGAGGDISIFSQPINAVAVDYLFDCFGFVV